MRISKSVWPIVVLGIMLALGLPSRPSSLAGPAPSAGALIAPARSDRISAQTASTATPTHKAVLVLFAFQPDLPVSKLAWQTMQDEFGSVDDLALTVYYEFLDSNRFSDSAYQQQLFDLYATKYRDKPIDLVMIETETTLSTWLKQRDKIAPNAPVVYFDTLSETFAAWPLPPDVTGVGGVLDYTQSIEWIMRARPAVNEVVLVHGVGAIDLAPDNIRPVEAFVQDMGQKVRITDLSNLPLPEIKRRVAALPPNSVVLSHPMFEDAAGDKYGPMAVLRALAAVSPVPVISGFDQLIGTGTIGGNMYSLEQQTRQAAQIGLRILRGEAASSIPRLNDQSGPFIFDHLALQRFGIPLSALPPDSIVKNRQYSFWELYRLQIIAALTVMAILLLLVVFLLGLTRQLNHTRLALAHLNANLETQVHERTAALSQAKTVAEQASAELAVSEARFRSYFELPLIGIAITSPEKGWLAVNTGVCAMLGYSAQELSGLTWAKLTHPDDLAADMAQFNRVLTSEVDTYALEKRFLHKDGHVIWTNLSVGCVRNPDRTVKHLVVLLQDISERKRAEEALRETRDYLDSLITYASAPIIVWDPNFIITRFNHAFEELAGIQAAGAIGQSLDILFPDEHREGSMALIRRTLAGERWQTVEIPILNRPTGSTKTVLWNSANVLARNGHTVLATIAQGIDITERVLAEQRAFELALERERMAVLSKFINDASHEFRTPLMIMQANLYLLERLEDGPKRGRKLAQIGEQVTGITRLVELLVEMARLDSGAPFTTAPTDLNLLVGAVAGKLGGTAATKGLTLLLALAPDLPTLAADGVRLNRALHELLDNAVRFTPAGGNITVRSASDAEGVTVEVQDSGPGIPPEALPHIFERFYRQDVAHTTPGFGLGLPIARAIIERHGGRLEVESQGGAGSVFRMTLPA